MGASRLRAWARRSLAHAASRIARGPRRVPRPAARLLLALLLASWATAHVRASEIIAGPMVGAVSDTTARLWMQLNTAEDVSVYAVDVATGRRTGGVETSVTGPMPFVCDAALPNLEPDRDYRVVVEFEGKPVDLPGPPVKIHTMPSPGQPAGFTVAFGSGVDAGASRALPVFRAIADLGPRAMVFLGDAGYLPAGLDAWPRSRRDAYRVITDLHHTLRTLPDLQPLLRTTACYAVWNDRDFGTAGADRTFVFSPEARVAFQVFWPNPSYGSVAAPGIFTSFVIGDAEFFLLDDRTYRDPDADPARQTMLGAGQLAWLKKQLAASSATFKIIMDGNPALADETPSASWGHYPAERDGFVRWLFQQHVSGVLFASGGRPFGELTRRPADPTNSAEYPLFDLTSSPLAGPVAGPETLAESSPQRVGPPITVQNFGTLEFAGPLGHRHVTLRLCDDAGRVLLQQVLLAGQLQSR
jgi:alkaline phosphatase D